MIVVGTKRIRTAENAPKTASGTAEGKTAKHDAEVAKTAGKGRKKTI